MYTDDTVMPWGEHKNKRLGDVPAVYLHGLLTQPWIREYKELYAYLLKNKSTLEQQAASSEAVKGSIDDGHGRIDTYEDYLRTYRGF
jgi:hypothetical protein